MWLRRGKALAQSNNWLKCDYKFEAEMVWPVGGDIFI